MTGARWSLPLAAVGVLAWLDALGGGDLGSGSFGVVAAVLASLLAGRRARLGPLVAAATAAIVLLAVADQVAAPGQFSLANDTVFYTVLVGGPAAIGALLRARSRQIHALRDGADALERRRGVVLAAARAEEASRMQHQVSQTLTGHLERVIDGVAAVTTERDAPARLADVESAARSALGELRELLGVLGATTRNLPPAPEPSGPSLTSATGAPLDAAARRDRAAPRWDLVDALLLLACVPVAVESVAAGDGPALVNIISAGLQGVLLTVVRRQPVRGSAALMLVAATQTAFLAPVPPMVSWLLPGLLVAYLTGIQPALGVAVKGLLVAVVGDLVVTWATPASDRALDGLAPGLALAGLTWWGGRTIVARDRRRDRLMAVTAELARVEEAESRLVAAQLRAEMTRELHDVGAHVLTVVCLQAGAAQRLWIRNPDQAQRAVETLHAVVREQLCGLDRSLAVLIAEDRAAADATDLGVLSELARALGLEIEVVIEGEPTVLRPPTAETAFRVVREALTNAARYAAHAQVRVELGYAADTLDVRIVDGGARSGPAVVSVHGAGLGLQGMRARVEAAGGALWFWHLDGGFVVHARLPLAPQTEVSRLAHAP